MGNSLPLNSKAELPLLPTEVWVKIWSFLDFDTLQKVCTRVSTKWFWDIRNSALLSGEMKLKLKRITYNRPSKLKTLSDEDFNTLLSHWLKLKILHLSGSFEQDKIKKIGSKMKNVETLDIGCTDDNLDLEWILRFKNLKTLKITRTPFVLTLKYFDERTSYVTNFGSLGANSENLKKMTGLKNLQLIHCGLTGDVVKFFNELPPGLKLALHQCKISSNIASLLDILNCLGKMKNIQILNNIIFCLDNDWEAQMTKDIMEKAKEITDQIFSGELDIWIEENKHQFKIWKLKGSCITFHYGQWSMKSM